MYRKIAVTNRKLCKNNFLDKILQLNVDMIILREKDMSANDYENLANDVLKLSCNKKIFLHSFIDVAIKLNCKNIHVTMPILLKEHEKLKQNFTVFGVSIHSEQELRQAEKLGANYVIYGHIFNTDCKKNSTPRGVESLAKICKNAQIPVYAIGGINDKNKQSVLDCGALGICKMSEYMK